VTRASQVPSLNSSSPLLRAFGFTLIRMVFMVGTYSGHVIPKRLSGVCTPPRSIPFR
jgi:hypothetical protein